MKLKLSIATLLVTAALGVQAETATFAYQNGWAYVPLMVMKELSLVEKHATAAKVDIKAEYRNLGSPGVIRDALIANQIQFGAVGVPTLIQLNDKTGTDIRAVGNIVSVPMYLNTNDANMKSVCDYANSTGKIALPTVKSSVQAVTLQMASKKLCGGDALKLDNKTVSMTHPDGMSSLMSGKSEVTGHFTSPPFQHVELEDGKGRIRTILNSYDVLGGKVSFILLVGSQKWRTSNPQAFEVIVKAFEEAQEYIRKNPKQTAEIYLRVEKPKEQLEDVIKQMTSPEVLFDSTPNHIAAYSSFMYETKVVKQNADWKMLTFPNLHAKQGS